MRRLQLAFTFCKTENEAQELCKHYDAISSAYCRRRYPAHYTSWESSDPRDDVHFIVWYHW